MGEMIRMIKKPSGKFVQLKLDYKRVTFEGETYLVGVLVDDVLPPMPAYGKTEKEVMDDLERTLATHLDRMKAHGTPVGSPQRRRLANYVRKV